MDKALRTSPADSSVSKRIAGIFMFHDAGRRPINMIIQFTREQISIVALLPNSFRKLSEPIDKLLCRGRDYELHKNYVLNAGTTKPVKLTSFKSFI